MDTPAGPRLSGTDVAVLQVLVANHHRVLGRESIQRLAGIDGAGLRRCDSSIVALRKFLGPDSIRTVRRRGWILTESGRTTGLRLLESSTRSDGSV